ncbi:MAG: hypothetical protein AB1351_01150 [Thermoproteota archaeon]
MIKSEQILAKDLEQMIIDRSEALIRQNQGFADGLDEIGALLTRYDPSPSPIMNAIDQKGQDFATYFFATYSETRDIERSIMTYKTVKSLVRYIVLMDRFYEVGNKKYERIARGLLQSIKKTHEGHLKYSIEFALKQFWPFWDFEQQVRKQMLKGHVFTNRELRHFNLFKSSDAPTIYSRVLDNELADFSPNVAAIMHYNQALLDIQDDFEDIEEDMQDGMPSIFILAATESTLFSKIRKNPSHARKLIACSGAVDQVLSIIDQYTKFIKDISVPQNFTFLKHLSRDYTDRLLRTTGILK